jgi:hypothetical protein
MNAVITSGKCCLPTLGSDMVYTLNELKPSTDRKRPEFCPLLNSTCNPAVPITPLPAKTPTNQELMLFRKFYRLKRKKLRQSVPSPSLHKLNRWPRGSYVNSLRLLDLYRTLNSLHSIWRIEVSGAVGGIFNCDTREVGAVVVVIGMIHNSRAPSPPSSNHRSIRIGLGRVVHMMCV